MAKKDFSYLFYPGDVLRHVQFFTKQQKGCYLEVLCSHIENIRFSYDFLMKITKELNEDDKREFVAIFEQDEQGYFLQWVVESIEKRAAYLLSRSDNKKGKKKKQRTKQQKSYDLHMEKENENKIENKEESKTEIIYPFDSENFHNVWQAWKDYKKSQHKFTYKGDTSEQAALKSLAEKSNNSEAAAIKIIQESIANGWKGFFELKNNGNGTVNGISAKQADEFTRNYNAFKQRY